MAFGMTPNYTVDLNLENLTPEQILALSVDTARQMGWNIHLISPAGFIAHTGKNLFASRHEITLRIDDGLAQLKSQSLGSEIADGGRNKKNIEAFVTKLDEARLTHTPEQLTQLYEELQPQLAPPEQDILSNPPPAGKDRGVAGLFIPRQGYFITPLLIDINIVLFAIMVLSGANLLLPSNHILLQWGANFKPMTLDGQWWRLLTCCFLHIGILHLLMNMYALMYIGLLLEPYLGRLRFIVAYLLTGLASSLASLYWHDLTVSAGASGAIFGMYGIFLAMLTTKLIPKEVRGPLLSSIAVFVGYNLLAGMKSGIDNAAHIGGLISGLLIGYLFYPGLRQPGNPRLTYSTLAVAALLILTTTVVAYKKMPNDIPIWQKNMESISDMERTAIAVLYLDSTATKEKWLEKIKDPGLTHWESCLQLAEDSRKLKIPAELKATTDKMIEYCQLRIDSYNYLYRKIAADSTLEGEDSTEYYKTRIHEILQELKPTKKRK